MALLVADAHPHLAMTSLLLRPSLSVRFCAVAAPPFWRLGPGLFHPVCPNVLIRWILPRVSARCDGNSSFKARRVLREVLNAREKERRQEVTPPVARTRRTRSEVSDDDEGDDDDDANMVGAGAAA